MKRFKTILFLSLLPALFFFASCEMHQEVLDSSMAHVEVEVYGLLSGNPRDGIRVSLHNSERDAKHGRNEVASRWTDGDGFVYLSNIPPGTYWIRAKALLVKNVKPAGYLGPGNHYLDIPIL